MFEEAFNYYKEGAIIIDVRTEGEYLDSNIKESVNIPLDKLSNAIKKKVNDPNKIILVHCASGNRSASAVSILNKLGYKRVYNIGGFGNA
ncbi:MAG: rhodanese protein, partial [uncultured bacterium]